MRADVWLAMGSCFGRAPAPAPEPAPAPARAGGGFLRSWELFFKWRDFATWLLFWNYIRGIQDEYQRFPGLADIWFTEYWFGGRDAEPLEPLEGP